jgi:hypothetical protein
MNIPLVKVKQRYSIFSAINKFLGHGRVWITRDMTFPRTSEGGIENEGQGKSQNKFFASKYCAEMSVNLR